MHTYERAYSFTHTNWFDVRARIRKSTQNIYTHSCNLLFLCDADNTKLSTKETEKRKKYNRRWVCVCVCDQDYIDLNFHSIHFQCVSNTHNTHLHLHKRSNDDDDGKKTTTTERSLKLNERQRKNREHGSILFAARTYWIFTATGVFIQQLSFLRCVLQFFHLFFIFEWHLEHSF